MVGAQSDAQSTVISSEDTQHRRSLGGTNTHMAATLRPHFDDNSDEISALVGLHATPQPHAARCSRVQRWMEHQAAHRRSSFRHFCPTVLHAASPAVARSSLPPQRIQVAAQEPFGGNGAPLTSCMGGDHVQQQLRSHLHAASLWLE